MPKPSLTKLPGLLAVLLTFSLLYGCSNSVSKTPSAGKASETDKSLDAMEQKIIEPEIPKSRDIEVRINTKPGGMSTDHLGWVYCSQIIYEGRVTNTGFQIAPIVEVNLSWDAEWSYGKVVKFHADGVETFRNLRPGETREISGVMLAVPGNKGTKRAFPDGPLLKEFKRGVASYDVKVYQGE